jgi:uncharacterized membrane protein YccC
MPDFTHSRRRQLKIHPEPELLLESIARSLETIAQGLTNIVETLDAIVIEDEEHRRCVRVVSP